MPNDTFTPADVLQNKIAQEVQNASDYVTETIDTLQNAGIMLNSAMQTASTEYDSIMKAEASKPLSAEIFMGIIMTVLPSLKLVERGAKVFGVVMPTGDTPLKGAAKAVKLVEDHYINLTKNFIDPVSQKKDKEENVSTAQSQLNARNATAVQVYGEFLDLLQRASDLATQSRKYIRMKQGEFFTQADKNISILPKIQKDFEDAKIGGNSKVGREQLVQMSNLLLYDMLKGYVGSYVVFKIEDDIDGAATAAEPKYVIVNGQKMRMPNYPNYAPRNISIGAFDDKAIKSRKIDDLPTRRAESLISGINSEQRKSIYKKFGDTNLLQVPPPKDGRSRPALHSYKDLIRHWGAKTVGKSGKSYTFT